MNRLAELDSAHHEAGARRTVLLRRAMQAAAISLLIGGQVVAFLLVRDKAPAADLAPQSLTATAGVATPAPKPAAAAPLPVAEARISYSNSEDDDKADEADDASSAEIPSGVPKTAAVKPTRVSVSVSPAGASVLLDGALIAPGRSLNVPAGSHVVVVRHEGYAPTSVPFDAPVGKTVNLSVELKPIPEPEPVATATQPSEPPTSDEPESPPPETKSMVGPARPPATGPEPKRAAATPRVGSDVIGDASKGKKVVRGGCSRCHSVSAKMYSRAQWSRFFASGRHDRYERLGERVSSGELAAAKAYLMKNAADAERDQGAGVR